MKDDCPTDGCLHYCMTAAGLGERHRLFVLGLDVDQLDFSLGGGALPLIDEKKCAVAGFELGALAAFDFARERDFAPRVRVAVVGDVDRRRGFPDFGHDPQPLVLLVEAELAHFQLRGGELAFGAPAAQRNRRAAIPRGRARIVSLIEGYGPWR